MDDIDGVLTMEMLYVDREWASSRSPQRGRRVIIRPQVNDDTP